MATEMKRTSAGVNRIEELLGDEGRALLDHKSQAIPKDQLYLPGPDYVDRVVTQSDRSPATANRSSPACGSCARPPLA